MNEREIYEILVRLERLEMKIDNIQNRVYDILEWIYPPKKEEGEVSE